MTKHALEVVEFKINEGISDAVFLDAIQNTETFISSLEGFIERHTAKNNEGMWIDVVKWRDMDAAKEAAKKFEASEEVREFISMINHSSMKMEHFEIKNLMMGAK